MVIIIHARDFNAAVVLEDGVVVRTAPILRYMLGWSAARVIRYAFRKGWTCEER